MNQSNDDSSHSIARRTLMLSAGAVTASLTATAFGKTATSKIDRRLSELGIRLPKPWALPPGLVVPASLVRVRGKRVFISGHVPIDAQGAVTGPFGRVGAEVSLEQGQAAARGVMLGIFASLKAKIGDLDKVAAWLRVFGMVQGAPGFTQFPQVVNGASQLLQDVFGPDVGDHARSAVGMAALPFNVPIEIEAEVELA